MSKLAKLFATFVFAAGLIAAVPGSALAQRHHHHGGWHGGRHGGWHGGWHRGGGWGGGFSFGWGSGYPFAYYPPAYYYPPSYYYPPRCGWTRVRVWRHGRWYWRRAWRCW